MKQIITITLLLSMGFVLSAQEKEVSVPFSQENAEKTLEIQLFSGDIKIIGSNRKDAVIKYEFKKNEEMEDGDKKEEKNGMKKIGGGNFQFEIGETNNTVRIQSQNFMNIMFLEIEVPSAIDIDISKQIGQNIYIENIQGAVNVENNVGSVTMKGISGSVNASSSTGEIKVDFKEIDSKQAMTFNTITGNIDLTFNPSHKADLKMRTEWGDIYSDMDIETKVVEDPETKSVSKEGNMKMISNNWTIGALNGGGSEMTLKTQMGSIYLRASN